MRIYRPPQLTSGNENVLEHHFLPLGVLSFFRPILESMPLYFTLILKERPQGVDTL